MWPRIVLALAMTSLVGACAGSLHQMPEVDSAKLNLAQTEVRNGAAPIPKSITDEEVQATVQRSIERIRPTGVRLCQEVGAGTCFWRFSIARDASINAGAGRGGLIQINRGIVEISDTDEEVAIVLAHEMGHHIANHLETKERNKAIGSAIGAIFMGVLSAAGSSYRDPYAAQRMQNAAENGAELGGKMGRLSFSKEQEREADYLAIVILYRAGMDLDKARNFMVKMARASDEKETGLFDTHPAGPDRLAAWDKALQDVKASKGALPTRKN
jgi:predicted Zn-dependent protease